MIIDMHSHAWQFPEHFDERFRQQARDVARADRDLDTKPIAQERKQRIKPLCLAAKRAYRVFGLTMPT